MPTRTVSRLILVSPVEFAVQFFLIWLIENKFYENWMEDLQLKASRYSVVSAGRLSMTSNMARRIIKFYSQLDCSAKLIDGEGENH